MPTLLVSPSFHFTTWPSFTNLNEGVVGQGYRPVIPGAFENFKDTSCYVVKLQVQLLLVCSFCNLSNE